MARIEAEFTKRNTELIGLSIDPVESRGKWASDMEETQGAKVKYPMIGDTDLHVARLYNLLPAERAPRTDGLRPPMPRCAVFIVGQDKKVKLMLTYPMTTGRNFDEIVRVLDSALFACRRIDDGRYLRDLVGRKSAEFRVPSNQGFVGGVIDAIDLIACDVTLDPVHAWSEAAQNTA
jgi:peroxiredoxin